MFTARMAISQNRNSKFVNLKYYSDDILISLKAFISPFVEESWDSIGVSSPSSGSIFFASCLPSSMGGAISTAIFDGYEWHVQSMPY